jgi:hypothetical protein
MSNTEDYIKILEKQNAELLDKLSVETDPSTYYLIRTLIDAKRKYITDKKITFGFFQHLSPSHLVKEYTTITFNIGRQMGHSTALCKIHNEEPFNSIYVVPRRTIIQHNKKGIHHDDLCMPGVILKQKLILADSYMSCNPSILDDLHKSISIAIRNVGPKDTPPILVIT